MKTPPIVDEKGQPISTDTRQPICIYTVANTTHIKYAIPFINSIRKFHDWPVVLYTDVKEKDLPKWKNVILKNLTPYLKDPMFYYRQKPILAEELLDEYQLVIGMDSDQLVLGNLDYILETTDYDVGTVINWNRTDPQMYGQVDLLRIGIAPVEYFNCGLVAIRNKKFAHHWMTLCYSAQFDRVQYREQDILNVLCYYGNYNIRCFDHGDGVAKYSAWHGLIGKGEWSRTVLRDNKIIVPQGLGDTPFPPADMEIKVVHLGGGKDAQKDNWAAYFPPEVMERITELVK